jgi:hypothetical protein
MRNIYIKITLEQYNNINPKEKKELHFINQQEVNNFNNYKGSV